MNKTFNERKPNKKSWAINGNILMNVLWNYFDRRKYYIRHDIYKTHYGSYKNRNSPIYVTSSGINVHKSLLIGNFYA